MADIIFYHNPMSRGQIIRWMLEEVGAPYDTEILDFRDPNNPLKTVGAPVTSAFPPGTGSTRPIIFGKAAR